MARRKVKVVVKQESDTGRNTIFEVPSTGEEMTRAAFTRKIDAGEFSGYYTRMQNGVKTPVSKPDGKESNNLG